MLNAVENFILRIFGLDFDGFDPFIEGEDIDMDKDIV